MLDIVEQVTGGKSLEDDRVELKAKWPEDFRKTARQIAGHANQAGGDTIMWLIGIDETRKAVVPVEPLEMADWWTGVERWFDELAPGFQYLTIPAHGEMVHALVLDSSRAPYVVKSDGQSVEREVPWRAGNKTRSARRSEILRSIVEESAVPHLECFGGEVDIYEDPDAEGNRAEPLKLTVRVRLNVYLEARTPSTHPQHRWQATLDVAGATIDCTSSLDMQGPMRDIPSEAGVRTGIAMFRQSPQEPAGLIEAIPGSGLRVNGSDAITVKTRTTLTGEPADILEQALKSRQRVTIALDLPLAGSARTAHIDVPLRRTTVANPKSRGHKTVARFAFQ